MIVVNRLALALGCKIHLYTDDAVLFVADPKAEMIKVELNGEISCAAKWLTTNSLTIYTD